MSFFRKRIKLIISFIWLLFFSISLYFYFFNDALISSKFLEIFSASTTLGYIIFLLASSLRGFTLIPVTYFILIGIVLLPPVPLFIITMVGVAISSLCVYYFSEYLNFDEYFEKNHSKQIDKLKSVISKNELPIVITWSFMPFLPTDLMCYVCGTLEVDIKKFVIGILIGEGIASAIYIFLGKEILSFV